jgi:hypothetical protein
MSGRCYIGACQGAESEKTYPSRSSSHAEVLAMRVHHQVMP